MQVNNCCIHTYYSTFFRCSCNRENQQENIIHIANINIPSNKYGKCYEKWSLETLPILPETWQLTISKDKEKQFSILKELIFKSDVTEVINACDAGREGELIFRFVMEKADCKKPVKRLWMPCLIPILKSLRQI